MEYNDTNRGVIQHRSRAKQLILFNGLRYGNTTPTDIDAYLDWGAIKVKIFVEAKYKDAEVPYGQRLAYERIVDDCTKAGTKAYAIICEHDVEEPYEPVEMSDAIVREVYDHERRWKRPNSNIRWTVKDFADYIWQTNQGKKHYMKGATANG